MSTASASAASAVPFARCKALAAVLESRYGVGAVAAPPVAVLWAAEHLAESEGFAVAKAQLSALNRVRERHGRIPAYAPWGSPLF